MSTSAPADECALPKCQVAKRNNVAHVARYSKLVDSAAAEKKELEEKFAKELRCKDDKVKNEQQRVKRLEEGHATQIKALENKLKDLKERYLPEKRAADKCRKDHALVNPGGATLVEDLASAKRRGDRLEREKGEVEKGRDAEAARANAAEEKAAGLAGEKRALEKSRKDETSGLKMEIERLTGELELAHQNLSTANETIRDQRDDLIDFKSTKEKLTETEELYLKKKGEVLGLQKQLKKEETENDEDKKAMDQAHSAAVKEFKQEIKDLEKEVSDLKIELDGMTFDTRSLSFTDSRQERRPLPNKLQSRPRRRSRP